MRRFAYAAADVGPSALASLVVGLLAVRLLDARTLGVYSILYSSAFLCAVAATQVVFLPFERDVATHERPADHLSGTGRAVARAVRVGALVSLVVVLLTLYLFRSAPTGSTLVLGLGAVGLAIASPIQDCVRRLAHIVDRGVVAVVTSSVQLLTMLALSAPLLLEGARSAGRWLIVALAVTNALSAAAGLVLLTRAARAVVEGTAQEAQVPRAGGVGPATVPLDGPGTADAADAGPAPSRGAARYRLAAGLLPDVTFNIGNLLIERIGGLALVGASEAARQFAQPVMVVGTAASNVLARTSLRAGAFGDGRAARRVRLLSAAGSAAAVAVVLAIAYLPPLAGPVRRFAPVAFTSGWLLPVTVVAHGVVVIGAVLTLELIGARRERRFFADEIGAGVALLAVCAATPVLGPLTRPAATLVSTLVRIVAGHAAMRPLYRRHRGKHRADSPTGYRAPRAGSVALGRSDRLRVRPEGRQ